MRGSGFVLRELEVGFRGRRERASNGASAVQLPEREPEGDRIREPDGGAADQQLPSRDLRARMGDQRDHQHDHPHDVQRPDEPEQRDHDLPPSVVPDEPAQAEQQGPARRMYGAAMTSQIHHSECPSSCQ